MIIGDYDGQVHRIVNLREMHEFNLIFLLNSYIKALATDEPEPHDYLMAMETKFETGTLNFGWRYQRPLFGKSSLALAEGVVLDLCGGETELLYLFKVFVMMDNNSSVWVDEYIDNAVSFIHSNLLLHLVDPKFFPVPYDVDYHTYVGARDRQGRSIVDYDVARATEMGTPSLLADVARMAMYGVVE